MANKSRFIIAESKIRAYFKDSPNYVFSLSQLSEILENNRLLWNLPASMNEAKFSEKLEASNIVIRKEIEINGIKVRFIRPDATAFQVGVSLINKSYLSHYTAVFLHGLTNQIPKTVYVSFEQSKKLNFQRQLEQKAIDLAFRKPQRKSNATAIYEGFTLLIHNGMYSNRSGVFLLNGLPVTNIERTLIDIAVRPNYSGGVYSVLDIYRQAIEKISVNKLTAILDKLNFIYPYHQTIGFYLQKAGMNKNQLSGLIAREKKNDFYLTYEMEEMNYNDTWKIYYPKGM